MIVGAWGGINFQVEKNNITQLQSLSESSSSSVSTHDAIARRQKIQWNGYNAGEITLKLVFDASVCRNPYAKYMQLKALEGFTSPLIVGRRRIGYHRWMLTGVSGDYTHILTRGAIYRIEVSATFKEYYDDAEA